MGLKPEVGLGAQFLQLKCAIGTQFKPLCWEEKGWGDEIGLLYTLIIKTLEVFQEAGVLNVYIKFVNAGNTFQFLQNSLWA